MLWKNVNKNNEKSVPEATSTKTIKQEKELQSNKTKVATKKNKSNCWSH